LIKKFWCISRKSISPSSPNQTANRAAGQIRPRKGQFKHRIFDRKYILMIAQYDCFRFCFVRLSYIMLGSCPCNVIGLYNQSTKKYDTDAKEQSNYRGDNALGKA
jgi:hypothetical protein